MEFILLKHLGLQPSEMDRMEFYRLEYLVDNFKEWNEEEKKRQEAEEGKQKGDFGSMSQMRKEFDGMRNSQMGSISAPKMPNFKI